jgi:DNA-binding NarL/FixJ family response regulator
MTIRVLVADDQPLIRQALRTLIDADPEMAVVAEASTAAEAVVRCRTGLADVVLMDHRMPNLNGVEASRQITSDPGLARVRVLMHTVFVTEELVTAALPAGVAGFLSKGVDAGTLLQTIRDVAGPRPGAVSAGGRRPRELG